MVNRFSWLVISFSCLLVGCASVKRPNSFVWGVNGPHAWLEGYDLLTDYDDNGILKPGAQKKFHPLPNGIKDLNAAILFLPPGKHEGDEGVKGVLRWIHDMRDWTKNHCQ